MNKYQVEMNFSELFLQTKIECYLDNVHQLRISDLNFAKTENCDHYISVQFIECGIFYQ